MSEAGDGGAGGVGPGGEASGATGDSGTSGGAGGAGSGEVGSVGEEAAKLFGALAGWAREAAPEPGVASSWSAAVREQVQTHLGAPDAAAPECTWCPVCRALGAARAVSPEVRAHLSTAASSLVQAAAGLLATVPPPPSSGPPGSPGSSNSPGPSGSSGPDFERIDLDGPGGPGEGTS